MFSFHNEIKLNSNNIMTTRKSVNTWKLNSILLKNPWVEKEVKKEIRKYTGMDINKKAAY